MISENREMFRQFHELLLKYVTIPFRPTEREYCISTEIAGQHSIIASFILICFGDETAEELSCRNRYKIPLHSQFRPILKSGGALQLNIRPRFIDEELVRQFSRARSVRSQKFR